MRYKISRVLPVFFLLCVLLLQGCAFTSAGKEQPITLNIWHVYGAQTDSPLNDFIRTFNETVGKEQGIQVEVSMVSNNKNIHKDILAAANHDPGQHPCQTSSWLTPKQFWNFRMKISWWITGTILPRKNCPPFAGVPPGWGSERTAGLFAGGQIHRTAFCQSDSL